MTDSFIDSENDSDQNFQIQKLGHIGNLGIMPSPPEFLLQAMELNENGTQERYAYAPPPEPETSLPKNIDYLLYQNVLNDRKLAETSYAEVYSKYIEVINFNQKLLRTVRRIEKFKINARHVYDNALNAEQGFARRFKTSQELLGISDKAIAQLEAESESLRVMIKTQDEAYQNMLSRVGEAEATMESANCHFEILAQEYENRGILLDESDHKIREYLAQMKEMSSSIKELQDKNVNVRDENLILQTQNRELQLREAAVTTLNSELADAVTKAQKQIHLLENTLRNERNQSGARIAVIEEDLQRFKDNQRADELVAKARETQKGNPVVIPSQQTPTPGPGANTQPAPRAEWNEFYNKWNQIISELSSHSKPLQEFKNESQNTELVSELGDIEIIEP